MNSPPWMPLYIGDFIADTMHLTATETGIYIRLLMHCWQHTVIPRDDLSLARIAHCDPRTWHFHKDVVLKFFQPMDAVWLQHPRVNRELHRAFEKSRKSKAAAKRMHSKRSANALRFIKEVSKKESTADSSEHPAPQQVATDEASKTASRDVATDSLARSMQKRGRR